MVLDYYWNSTWIYLLMNYGQCEKWRRDLGPWLRTHSLGMSNDVVTCR